MPEGIREEPANTVPVPFVSDTGPVPSQRPQWQDGLQLHPLFLVHSAGSGSCPVVEGPLRDLLDVNQSAQPSSVGEPHPPEP